MKGSNRLLNDHKCRALRGEDRIAWLIWISLEHANGMHWPDGHPRAFTGEGGFDIPQNKQSSYEGSVISRRLPIMVIGERHTRSNRFVKQGMLHHFVIDQADRCHLSALKVG